MGGLALRLYHDRLAPGTRLTTALPAAARIVYAAEGKAMVGDRILAADAAMHATGAVAAATGESGALLFRWEVAPAGAPPWLAASTQSRLVLDAAVALDPAGAWLMRCERVDFPPGGTAAAHSHPGPGIGCLLSGRLSLEIAGAARAVAPQEAWAAAAEAVVAAAAGPEGPAAFIRVLLLPAALQGQRSIRYVKPEGAAPEPAHRILAEAPLAPGPSFQGEAADP